jgi:hypothetical protein
LKFLFFRLRVFGLIQIISWWVLVEEGVDGVRVLMLRKGPKALVTMRAQSRLKTGATMRLVQSRAIKTLRCEGEAYLWWIRLLNFCKV